jgi:hypothetical protein
MAETFPRVACTLPKRLDGGQQQRLSGFAGILHLIPNQGAISGPI